MPFVNPKERAFAGAPLDLRFRKIIDADAGGAVDLTGKTLSFVLVQANGIDDYETEPVVTKTGPNASQIEVTSEAGGACVVHLAGSDTADLSGLYRYQLTVVDGTAADPVAFGLIEFAPSLHA